MVRGCEWAGGCSLAPSSRGPFPGRTACAPASQTIALNAARTAAHGKGLHSTKTHPDTRTYRWARGECTYTRPTHVNCAAGIPHHSPSSGRGLHHRPHLHFFYNAVKMGQQGGTQKRERLGVVVVAGRGRALVPSHGGRHVRHRRNGERCAVCKTARKHAHTHAHTRAHTHTQAWMNRHTHACTCIRTHTCTRALTHTHTRVHNLSVRPRGKAGTATASKDSTTRPPLPPSLHMVR
jgi:hypothetical protein